MKTTIRYVLITALRDWLFIGIVAALLVACFIAHFMGSTVLVEKNEISSSFTAGSARIVLTIGMIVFVCFHVRRAFENKEIDLMLSRPISREQFVVAYWLGFSVVATSIIALVSIFMTIYGFNLKGLLFWAATMEMEILIVLAFAVFASIILRSSVSAVLLCFGFYAVSRMVGFFSYILDKQDITPSISMDFASQKIIWLVSLLLPRLDLFSQSKWLVYGVNFADYPWYVPVAQAIIYVPLLLTLAAIDFKRKQF